MRITNKHKLPGALVTYAHLDPYERGEADISVTELIDAPRLRIMKQIYNEVVSVDVADSLQAMLGTAFHRMMEEGDEPDVEKEQRLYMEVDGWVVSGQIDRAVDDEAEVGAKLITDYKTTNVTKLMRGAPEWYNQLVLYGLLYHKEHGVFPSGEVVALLKDWRQTEALQSKTYPEHPVLRVPVYRASDKLLEEAKRYMAARVKLHQQAQELHDSTGEVVECASPDRWVKPDTWAVMARGRKNAIRVFNSVKDAEFFRASAARGTYIEKRPGADTRCEHYCVFKEVCTQYQDAKRARVVAKMLKIHDNNMQKSRSGDTDIPF